MSFWSWFDHACSILGFAGISVLGTIRYIRKVKHRSYAYLKPYILTSGIILVLSLTISAYINFDWYSIFHPKVTTVYIDTSKSNSVLRRETVYAKQPIIIYGQNKIAKQKDTNKILAPTNGIISTGGNAHNVAGSNNHVDVNGDVINEPKLITSEANEVLIDIDSIRLKYKSNNKAFIMYVNSDSNLKTYSYELKDFLVAHGYILSAISSGEDSFNGIKIGGKNPTYFYVIMIGNKVKDQPFPISVVNTY